MNSTIGGTVLNQDFKEFIQYLNSNDVAYLIVGGYAVSLHGNPRYTKDLDIWLEMSPLNAQKVIKALDQFGFASLGLQASDFMVPNQVVQLGYPPNRIDLLTNVDGVIFSDCYDKRITVEIDSLHINFIDLANLRINKKASGRPQDLADLAALE